MIWRRTTSPAAAWALKASKKSPSLKAFLRVAKLFELLPKNAGQQVLVPAGRLRFDVSDGIFYRSQQPADGQITRRTRRPFAHSGRFCGHKSTKDTVKTTAQGGPDDPGSTCGHHPCAL